MAAGGNSREDGLSVWEEEEEEDEEAGEETPSGEGLETEAPWALGRKTEDGGPPALKMELHPLQTSWALWFFKSERGRVWRDNLQLVTSFGSVEDFWAVHSNIKPPSKLSPGCDYALFRAGIEPMWEDSQNKRGGRWLVSLAKQQRLSDLDRLWRDTLLCLIGENFGEHGPDVCGAVVNIRTKGDKMAVWTREAENQASVLHIGRVFKECLGLSSKATIGYQAHADTASKSSVMTRNKFVV